MKKPEHNLFDNIYEIRKTPGFEAMFKDFLRGVAGMAPGRFKREARPRRLTYIYYLSPEAWAYALISHRVQLPVWKILVSEPNSETGAIYYVFRDEEGVAHVFRGTYGYGYMVERRNGDYLLDLLAPPAEG